MKESYSLRTQSTFDTEREVAIADEFTAAFKHELHRGLKSRQIAMAPHPPPCGLTVRLQLEGQ